MLAQFRGCVGTPEDVVAQFGDVLVLSGGCFGSLGDVVAQFGDLKSVVSVCYLFEVCCQCMLPFWSVLPEYVTSRESVTSICYLSGVCCQYMLVMLPVWSLLPVLWTSSSLSPGFSCK